MVGQAAVVIQRAARARQARKTVAAVKETERLKGVINNASTMHNEEGARNSALCKESIDRQELLERLDRRSQSRRAWSQFRYVVLYTATLLISTTTMQAPLVSHLIPRRLLHGTLI